MSQTLYRPSTYDELPSLYEAGKMFDTKHGQELVDEKFRKLFLQHGMDRVFGLSLLHRHFDLGQNELLVEYGGTAVPWQEHLAKSSSYIRPSNWSLSGDGTFHPFEFSYSMHNDEDEQGDLPSHPKKTLRF